MKTIELKFKDGSRFKSTIESKLKQLKDIKDATLKTISDGLYAIEVATKEAYKQVLDVIKSLNTVFDQNDLTIKYSGSFSENKNEIKLRKLIQLEIKKILKEDNKNKL